MKTLWIAALGLAWLGNASAENFKFGQYIAYPIEGSAADVAIGDVTGDGRNDVVVAVTASSIPENAHSVFVYAQQSDGTLKPPAKYPYSSEPFRYASVVLGDMNKDGLLDIVVGHEGGLTLLTANSAGGFSPHHVPTPYFIPFDLGLTDIDLDGKMDVVGLSQASARLFYGDGLGGIRDSSTLPLSQPSGLNSLKIGDVTGDGYSDLVITSGYNVYFFVYTHNGVNGFNQPRWYPEPSPQGWLDAAAILDFNQDGRNDIVVAAYVSQSSSQLWLYAQNASGELESPQPLAAHYGPINSMAAADLNRDGKRDLLVNHGTERIGRYIQHGNGLLPETSTRVPQYVTGLAAGDVNGDDCIDAAVASYSPGALVIVPGCPLQPAIGKDVNGDRKSDLLWGKGESVAYWLMNGHQIVGTGVSGNGDAGFKIVAGGDYDGDGFIDLTWSNGNQLKFWINDRNGGYVSSDITYYGSEWQPFASVDLDSDGNDDLLWRQGSHVAHWLMDGAHVRAPGYTADGGAGFKIIAAGDFNDDGASDLALSNGGLLKILMNQGDASFVSGSAIAYGGGWQPFSASDIDGDGKSDLLWRSGSALAYWLMDGAGVRSSGYAGDAGTGFSLVASGDYDGDGAGDLIFSSGNQVQSWVNNGNGFDIASWYYGDGWQPFDPQIPTH